MVMFTSLAVPKKVQGLARRIGMGLSSFWESVSGGMEFSLPDPKCGSEVLSPAGECGPQMVAGGAQIRSVSQSSRICSSSQFWELRETGRPLVF